MTHNPSVSSACPIPLDRLALLLRSDDVRLKTLLMLMPEPERASLAIYCYDRYHMRRLGMDVARHCSPLAFEAGGKTAEHLLELAEQAVAADLVRSAAPVASQDARSIAA